MNGVVIPVRRVIYATASRMVSVASSSCRVDDSTPPSGRGTSPCVLASQSCHGRFALARHMTQSEMGSKIRRPGRPQPALLQSAGRRARIFGFGVFEFSLIGFSLSWTHLHPASDPTSSGTSAGDPYDGSSHSNYSVANQYPAYGNWTHHRHRGQPHLRAFDSIAPSSFSLT